MAPFRSTKSTVSVQENNQYEINKSKSSSRRSKTVPLGVRWLYNEEKLQKTLPGKSGNTENPEKSSYIPEALKRLEFTREDSAEKIAEKLLNEHYDYLSMCDVKIENVISEMQKKERETQKGRDLVEAQFKQCEINAKNLEKILDLLHVNKVTSLDIGWNVKLGGDMKQLYSLLRRRGVDRLDISKCALRPEHLQEFRNAIPERDTYKLQELDISNLKEQTEESLNCLASILHRLNVVKFILAESKINLEKLLENPMMKHITSLDLSYNTNITQKTMDGIASLKLEELVLCGCKLKSSHLKAIADKQCHVCKLRKLDIRFNKFSREEDGEIIGRLVAVCGIQSLDISYAHLTTEMLQAFLELLRKTKTVVQLKDLKVDGNCGMGNSGLICLADILNHCKEIKNFYFLNCDISPKEMKTLGKFFKKPPQVTDDNDISAEDDNE